MIELMSRMMPVVNPKYCTNLGPFGEEGVDFSISHRLSFRAKDEKTIVKVKTGLNLRPALLILCNG